MKIVQRPLKDIKPYWRNPRDNEPAVGAVKQSIEKYGFNSPIVVDPKGVIIAGHTRYKALLELGWEKAPVVVADLDPQKAKEYRIADNKTAEFATWNTEALIQELRELEGIGDMQGFFHDMDLDSLLKGTATITPPTQEEINTHQEGADSRFSDGSEAAQGNYVEVTCPHCMEDFFVDRAEVSRRPPVALPDEENADAPSEDEVLSENA
jgi:hypothetical protein